MGLEKEPNTQHILRKVGSEGESGIMCEIFVIFF